MPLLSRGLMHGGQHIRKDFQNLFFNYDELFPPVISSGRLKSPSIGESYNCSRFGVRDGRKGRMSRIRHRTYFSIGFDLGCHTVQWWHLAVQSVGSSQAETALFIHMAAGEFPVELAR